MKLPLILVLYFFSFNLFSQIKLNENTNIEIMKNYKTIDNFKGNIIVISILNLKNPNEITALRNLSEKFMEVTFIAVIDGLSDTEISQLKEQLKYHVFLSKDENDKIFNTYETGKFKTFPIHILIDTNGTIKYKKKKEINIIEYKLSNRIEKLIYSK